MALRNRWRFELASSAPTDKTASTVTSRPIDYSRCHLATLYHNLGIDSSVSAITDLSDRPCYLLDDVALVRELVG